MLRAIICTVAIMGCLILGSLLWLHRGMGGLAAGLVWIWAALMVYLVILIILRIKQGAGSDEVRFHTQMAPFLARHEEAQIPRARAEMRSEGPGTDDAPLPR